jgi:predicted Fe-Mo cluster-binding NifX family protein
VSPVFDVARTLRVVDIDRSGGALSFDAVHAVNPTHPAESLTDLGVELLICSAISSSLESSLTASGVDVVADVCGSPDEIIDALVGGDSELARFRTPGWRGKTRRPAAGRSTTRRNEPKAVG